MSELTDITRSFASEYALQVEARLEYIIRPKPTWLPRAVHHYLLRRLFRYEVLKKFAITENTKE